MPFFRDHALQADTNVDGKIQYGEFVRWLFTDGSDQVAAFGFG